MQAYHYQPTIVAYSLDIIWHRRLQAIVSVACSRSFPEIHFYNPVIWHFCILREWNLVRNFLNSGTTHVLMSSCTWTCDNWDCQQAFYLPWLLDHGCTFSFLFPLFSFLFCPCNLVFSLFSCLNVPLGVLMLLYPYFLNSYLFAWQ